MENISENGQDMGWKDHLAVDFFTARVQRINHYFEALTKSFGIMVNGMEKTVFKVSYVFIASQWISVGTVPPHRNLYHRD